MKPKTKNHLLYRLLIAVLLPVVLGVYLGYPSSAESDTTVDISPSSRHVDYGDGFDIDVYVDPTVNLAGAQFDMSFNPALIRAYSVTEGNLLKQGGCSTFFQMGTIDNNTGTIRGVACAITQPSCYVSSAGIIATIHFSAVAAQGTSELKLSKVVLGNPEGYPIPITVNNGSVTIGYATQIPTKTVQPAPTSTPTAIPTTRPTTTAIPTRTPTSTPKSSLTATPATTPSLTPTAIPTAATTPAPNSEKDFTATISPATSYTGGTQSYIITLTAIAASEKQIHSVAIDIPLGFTNIAISSVTASKGGSWSGTISSGTMIVTSDIDTDKLDSGECISITFTATSPEATGLYEWTAQPYSETGNGIDFTIKGTQPEVIVVPEPVEQSQFIIALQSTGGPDITNDKGILLTDINISSQDGRITAKIADGTQIKNPSGQPVSEITIEETAATPPIPEGYFLIEAFEFGPDGTTFSSALQITLKYDIGQIPAGQQPVIAFYDESTGQWNFLIGTVDTYTGTFTFSIAHFTAYVLMGLSATPIVHDGMAPWVWIVTGICILLTLIIVARFNMRRHPASDKAMVKESLSDQAK